MARRTRCLNWRLWSCRLASICGENWDFGWPVATAAGCAFGVAFYLEPCHWSGLDREAR